MILLEEAVARFNRAGRHYGVSVTSRRTNRRALLALSEIEEAIAPLRLPNELRSFWSRFDPASIAAPVLDGFIPLEQIVERRQIECPPAPNILLPIADWTRSRIFIELESDLHPGGRIFHGRHEDSQVGLWAFGLSGLLDLLSIALERDLLDDRLGTLDSRGLNQLVASRLRDALAPGVRRRFEAVDRSCFELHWLAAEGLPIDHFQLKGATHSVKSLKSERQFESRVKATLVGRFQPTIGGGPLGGTLGVLTDDSGSLQVFLPQSTAVMGAVGPSGEVEMDVYAVPVSGTNLDSLEEHQELERAVRAGWAFDERALVDRLFAQLHELDMSIVVTALRPIR